MALEPVRDPALVAPDDRPDARPRRQPDAARPIDGSPTRSGRKRVLLVLDNFEQVVAAGPDVADLLRRCPNVDGPRHDADRAARLRRAGVPGAGPARPARPEPLSEVERLNLPRALREFDLETLNQFEAVRLFIARASAVRPGFAVTNANAPAVAGICARLHGMPLAIELAAARVKLLTPDQILARLEHHLAVLTAGSRDLPERQQTLRGAIAWSYDLLDDGARRLLDRLSVFRGGFELDVAETRLRSGATRSAATSCDAHRRARRPEPGPARRGRRRPARSRCSRRSASTPPRCSPRAARRDAIDGRHAAAMLDLAERAAPAPVAGRTSASGSTGSSASTTTCAPPSTGRPPGPDPDIARRHRVRALAVLAAARLPDRSAAPARGDGGQAWTLEPVDARPLRRGVRRRRLLAVRPARRPPLVRRGARGSGASIGDKREIANALYNRAYADMIVDHGAGSPTPEPSSQAVGERLDEALAIYRELGDQRGEGNVLWGLGSHHYFTRRRRRRRAVVRALARAPPARPATGRWRRGRCTCSARPRSASGDFDEARDIARHALRHFYEAGDVSGITLILDDLAIIAVGPGDPDARRPAVGGGPPLQAADRHGPRRLRRPDTIAMFGAPTPRTSSRPRSSSARRGGRGDEPRRDRRVCSGGADGARAPTHDGGPAMTDPERARPVPPIVLVDDDAATRPAGARRRRSGRRHPDLRQLRRRDGRAQVQAHLPLRLLPVLLGLLLSAGRAGWRGRP